MAWQIYQRLPTAPVRACSVACVALVAAVLLALQQAGERGPSHAENWALSQRWKENQVEIESLVQMKTHVRSVRKSALKHAQKRQEPYREEICLPLRNRGSHFTVEINAGTPGQKLDLLVDTGSSTLWVASCACKPFGQCFEAGKCFVGTNLSSTFSVRKSATGPPVTTLSYGSGTVNAVITSDMVGIGPLRVWMNNSLLLAVDHQLNIGGEMEGILPLGIPQSKLQSRVDHTQSSRQQAINKKVSRTAEIVQQVVEEAMHRIFNTSNDSNDSRIADMMDAQDLPLLLELNHSLAIAGSNRDVMFEEKGFLETAGIDAFQICFSEGAVAGTLRLGVQPSYYALPSVGMIHWGVGLDGISVGSDGAPAATCKKVDPDQETACAAIVDSGTTLISVPTEEQLLDLLVSICDAWERCKRTVSRQVDSIIFTKTMKANVLTKLITQCDSWLHEGDGWKELPTLHFHVSGKDGSKQTLALTPWAYIVETTLSRRPSYDSPFSEPGELNASNSKQKGKQKVCSLEFQVMPWSTTKNGPVWILGMPFFYQFLVGYHMKEKTISFTSIEDYPCAPCDSSLVQRGNSALEPHSEVSGQRLRYVDAPPRPSSLDARLPL